MDADEMHHRQGFSLLELLFTTAIFGICLTTALPQLNQTIQAERARSATNTLLSVIYFARGQAVYLRTTVGICPGDLYCNNATTWERHLLIFNDSNLNGKLDSDESLLRTIELTEQTQWLWNGFRSNQHLQFSPDGTTRALNGTFTLCIDKKPISQIVINLAGRARKQSAPQTINCL